MGAILTGRCRAGPFRPTAGAAGRPGSRADAWRPWRAYAVMYLWQHSAAARADARETAARPAVVRRTGNRDAPVGEEQ